MKRIEIMATQAIEVDIIEELKEIGCGMAYTIVPSVKGIGRTNPKMGNAIWPEENFLMIIYCDDEKVAAIEKAVETVRARFPEEGIGFFAM